MHTTTPMPAAAASMIAAGASRGGTAMKLAVAPVAMTASATESKIGMPSTSWPPLPGVTPATTLVPSAAVAQAVKASLTTGKALDHACRLVDEDAHSSEPPCDLGAPASSTAHRAALSMVRSLMIFSGPRARR